jgi:hypothetical protein
MVSEPRDALSDGLHPVDPRPPFAAGPLEGDVVGAFHMLRDQARRQGDAEDAWIDSKPPLEVARKLLHQARRGGLDYGTKRATEAGAYATIAVAERLDYLIQLFTQPDPEPQDAIPAPLEPFHQQGADMAVNVKGFLEDVKTDIEGILGNARGVPAEIAGVLQGTLSKLHEALSNVEGEVVPEVEKDAEQVASDAETAAKAEAPGAEQSVVSGAEQIAADVAAAVEPKSAGDATANAAGTVEAASTGEAPTA